MTLSSRVAPAMNLDEPLRSYWRRRLELVFHDSYMGRPMCKFPEDLRAYERFMWEMRADAVIEIGVQHGGSTLWFRDRLRALGGGTVIAIDIISNQGLPDDIVYLQDNILDSGLPDKVRRLLPPGARPFIVEDSAHTYETTISALNGFHDFVPDGGYFIVEDSVVDVDELRISDEWPRGVRRAIDEFVAAHPRFRQVESPYGVTSHPGGFLLADAGDAQRGVRLMG